MPELVWDKVGDRFYESGLDKGVLYLYDGSGVPWNGLTSIIEKFDKSTSPVYYDGMKISELVALGDFSASMKAVTYPDEFVEIEGLGQMRHGMFLSDQPPQVFALSYRTSIGNDLEGNEAGYKIHILYNVTAIPNDKAYASTSLDPSLVEFEWDIVAVPEEVPGFRPTSHIIIDSRKFDPLLLIELEKVLYGDSVSEASLIPMPDLISFISGWYRIKITDNGDGTWTADSLVDSYIEYSGTYEDLVTILYANAVYLNDYTYEISDTMDVGDIPKIRFVDNGNGTWTASTVHYNIFTVDSEQRFEISNVDPIYIESDLYRVSDTV